MKFIIEMNVHELSRTIEAGTLGALVTDVQRFENQVANKPAEPKSVEPKSVEQAPVAVKPEPIAKTETEQITDTQTDQTKEQISQYTREDVRAAFVAKNSPSTRDKLKAILDKFNTPNITELEEKHFDDVMKELEAM